MQLQSTSQPSSHQGAVAVVPPRPLLGEGWDGGVPLCRGVTSFCLPGGQGLLLLCPCCLCLPCLCDLYPPTGNPPNLRAL